MKIQLIFLLSFFITITGYTQDREISGKILVFNKFPVKNIKVVARKSKSETLTDENGEFKITVGKNETLLVEGKSFEKFTRRIGDDEQSVSINIIYIDKKKNKDTVVDMGYVNREDLEYGLKNLAKENNVYGNFIDVFDAIKSALPTATFIQENGIRKVRFRGIKSREGSNAALMAVNGFLTEDISYIIPSSIISIKLLTPSAASIYGTGSGNGVIAIVTE